MQNKNYKRILAMILCIIMSLTALTGCGSSEQAAAPGGNSANTAETPKAEVVEGPKEEIVITMGTNTAFHDIRPYVGTLVVEHVLIGMHFDRLVQAYTNGDIFPRGADSWEISEDQHSVTFHLNKNAKWTDGTPVTAHDYEFAAQVLTTEGCPATRLVTYSTLVGVDSKTYVATGEGLGIEVIDDYTIKYTYKEPFVPEIEMFNNVFSYIALPKHLLKDEDPTKYLDWEFWKNPVTNGPLKLESEIVGSEVVYVKNEDYHLGAPKFDKLKVVLMDASNMASAMIAGDIDIAYPAPSDDDMKMLATQDGIHIFEMPYPTMMRSVFINNELMPDARVRRALDMAVDREAICAALGNVIPMSTPIDPNNPYYDETAGIRYDPEGAKALLAEAAADGAIDLSQPLPLCVVPGVGQTVANIVQQNWTDIGLIVEQQQMENSAVVAGLRKSTIMMGTINRMYCCDPTKECYVQGAGVIKPLTNMWDDLRIEFINAASQEEREDIIDKFQHLWLEEVPHIPIGGAFESYAYSDRVGDGESIGVECAQTGSFPVWQWNVKP